MARPSRQASTRTPSPAFERPEDESFESGAVILLDGEKQKTANDEENPTTVLIGKKAGKKIASGQTVLLQVRNRDGGLSEPFSFTRP